MEESFFFYDVVLLGFMFSNLCWGTDFFNVLILYWVFIAQADWTLFLLWATSCKSDESPVEKNACRHSELVAHIVYFFH
jgi:hypothetical protein